MSEESYRRQLQEQEDNTEYNALLYQIQHLEAANTQLRDGIQHTLDNWDGTADETMYQALKQLLGPHND